MSPITTHVLDTVRGMPARGVVVVLEVSDGEDRWTELGRGTTSDDGRITAFDPPLGGLKPGILRLRMLRTEGLVIRRRKRNHMFMHWQIGTLPT